jgi:methyl-accepting chemotaxis protein
LLLGYPSRRRTEKKSGPPALDIILQGVREGLKTLKLAIDGARDETIENTNTGVGHILHRIIATNTSIEQIGMDLGRQDQKLEGVNDMVLEIRCITTQFANQVLCIGSAVDSLQGDVGDLRSQMLNQVESLARMIEGQFALWSTQPGLCNDVYQFLREDLSRQ